MSSLAECIVKYSCVKMDVTAEAVERERETGGGRGRKGESRCKLRFQTNSIWANAVGLKKLFLVFVSYFPNVSPVLETRGITTNSVVPFLSRFCTSVLCFQTHLVFRNI